MEQTVRYYTKTGFGSWVVRKTQVQDDEYGIAGKAIQYPYVLGYKKDGVLLIGRELLEEMRRPVWGDNGDLYFWELLPVFPRKVSELIYSGFHEWRLFNAEDPSTYPTTECPDMGQHIGVLGGPRGWEGESSAYPGLYYQNLHWMGPETVLIWSVLGIWRYRQQNEGVGSVLIPNPEYEVVEAERQAAFEVYRDLVRSILVPVGYYQFQGLPLNSNSTSYKWRINNDARIDPIPGHKLANGPGNTGWKFIAAPMRCPEMITRNTSAGPVTIDLYEEVYGQKLAESSWDLSRDEKVVFLAKE